MGWTSGGQNNFQMRDISVFSKWNLVTLCCDFILTQSFPNPDQQVFVPKPNPVVLMHVALCL